MESTEKNSEAANILLEATISTDQHPPDNCCFYGVLMQQAFRWGDCGPNVYACETCIVEQHNLRPFLCIQTWKVIYQVYYMFSLCHFQNYAR